MEIRNVQTFIRVAELKSFTRVAKEMNYVQSTVTMQIQQLEKELGYPLFDRIGKTVSLTALGEEFLSYAYELVRIMRKAVSLNRDLGEIRGTLRLGVLESLLFGTVLDILPAYKAACKNLDLQLKMGQTTELLQQLKQNQLDMVYLSADLNTDPELRCCYQRAENLIFLSAPGHPLAAQQRIPAETLFGFDFVVTERSGICYSRLQALAARHNAMLRAGVEVDSTVAIASLLRKEMGIAFLPEYSVSSYLRQGSLIRLDVDLPPQIYYSQILCHKNRWISPFMDGLIQAIQAARTPDTQLPFER